MEKEIRRHFSKIGFAYLAGSIVIYAVQFLAAMVGKKFVPGVMADANGSFIVLMLTMYGISMPFMGWLVSRIPAQKIEGEKLTAGQWIIAFLMCYGLMYAGNLIGTALTFGIGMVKGTGVDNPLVSTVMQLNPWVTFIIAVLIAPTAEELLFRKLLTERIVKYGELAAVLASGLFFGLFHGNLNQFSYAYHRTPYGDKFYRLFPRHVDASGDGLYGYDGNTDGIFKYKESDGSGGSGERNCRNVHFRLLCVTDSDDGRSRTDSDVAEPQKVCMLRTGRESCFLRQKESGGHDWKSRNGAFWIGIMIWQLLQ